MNFLIKYVFIVILWHFNIVSCGRTSDKIYAQLNSDFSCFRRFNATHQIGCNSGRGGNVGVLHYIQEDADLDWVLDNGPHQPYVLLLHVNHFQRSILNRIKESGKVNGILYMSTNVTDPPQSYSPDSSCPNQAYSLYRDNPTYHNCKNVTWNPSPEINDMMFVDFPFPIIRIKDQDNVTFLIEDCYEKFNKPSNSGVARSYPLCGTMVKTAMDGAKDTPTCIRRSKMITNLNPETYCDPLGAQNVFSPVLPWNASNQRIIMAASRLDTFSMFDNSYPGADSAVTGMVALLAAAEAIGRVKGEFTEQDKAIMFTFLNGEAFDYMASERFVYEMEQGNVPYKPKEGDPGPSPIGLENITSFIELHQVWAGDNPKLYLHTDPISMTNDDIKVNTEDLTLLMKEHLSNGGIDVTITPQSQPLPPSSFQNFLRARNISGSVVTNHQREYTNKYYNSMFDVAENIGLRYDDDENDPYNASTSASEYIEYISTGLARTLYQQARGLSINETRHIAADQKLISNMLYCFLVSPKCELFKAIVSPDNANKLSEIPYNFYVGVHFSSNHIGSLSRQLLAYFLGDREPTLTNKDACQNARDPYYSYIWMNGPVNYSSPDLDRSHFCIKHCANTTTSKSPAFDIKDYDFSSNQYTAWTESRWANSAIQLKTFLLPSKTQEVWVLVFSLILTLACMPFAYFLHKRGHLLFIPSSQLLNTSASTSSSNLAGELNNQNYGTGSGDGRSTNQNYETTTDGERSANQSTVSISGNRVSSQPNTTTFVL